MPQRPQILFIGQAPSPRRYTRRTGKRHGNEEPTSMKQRSGPILNLAALSLALAFSVSLALPCRGRRRLPRTRRRGGKDNHGRSVQPVGIAINNRYATPVHFLRKQRAVRIGEVAPLDDRIRPRDEISHDEGERIAIWKGIFDFQSSPNRLPHRPSQISLFWPTASQEQSMQES
jgi:hypothetical protein